MKRRLNLAGTKSLLQGIRWAFRRSPRLLLAGGLLFALCWVVFPFRSQRLGSYADTVYLRDRAGTPLRTLLGADDLKCEPVALDQVSPWVGMALIAAEDKRFYAHPGVDPLAILRASWQNVSNGWVVSGASTLSTQIIRMTTPRKRHLGTKLAEAFRALQMEQRFDKDQILAQYLNRAPFGSNVLGIQAASRFYFGKDAAHLSLGEAALLMGLPQAPSRFRPDRYLKRALKRRDYVLQRMRELKMINADQHRAASEQPLAVGSHPESFAAPHFCDLLHATRPLTPGVHNATLDPDLQRLAEEELQRQSKALQPHGVFGGAVVILEVRSGAVRALVGSPDYFAPRGGQVNAAVAARSPGSTLKPFAFAQAFDQGRYTPDRVLGDVPLQFKEYLPRNSDREHRGLVTVRDALVESLNIPAIRAVQAIGLENFAQQLRALGIRGIDQPASHYGVSMVLGTVELRLLDLATAYACLAREGLWQPFRLLEAEAVPEATRIFSPGAAWFISDILGGEERSMAFSGHSADTRLPRVAWKTGTSNDHRDAWTLGYNPEYVVGVWMGNPGGEGAAALTGINAAAPLVSRIFRRLYPDGNSPWYVRPAELRPSTLCRKSGQPLGPHCPEENTGWMLPGTTAMTPCRVHQLLPHDRHTGKRLPMSGLRAHHVDWRVTEKWPRPVAAFLNAQRQGTRGAGEPAPALGQQGTQGAVQPPPAILSPMDGSTLRLMTPPGGDKASPLALKARCADPREILYWFANQHFLGSTRADETFFWQALPGQHQIRCSTASGGVDVALVVVE